ncbi:MAG TPA: hypothetical protein VIZ69_07350, partial [Thermoanaerobaculia bacterium]
WRGFWTERLQSTAPTAPLAGVSASGWKLVYTAAVSEMLQAREAAGKYTDVRFSIGFLVNDDGTIPDVVPESPAAKAGVGPGMKLVAVNGRRWVKETLREAIRASASQAIELLVENGEFFRTYRLDYSGGERYPHLERDTARPDLLSSIIAPRAAPAGK